MPDQPSNNETIPKSPQKYDHIEGVDDDNTESEEETAEEMKATQCREEFVERMIKHGIKVEDPKGRGARQEEKEYDKVEGSGDLQKEMEREETCNDHEEYYFVESTVVSSDGSEE